MVATHGVHYGPGREYIMDHGSHIIAFILYFCRIWLTRNFGESAYVTSDRRVFVC